MALNRVEREQIQDSKLKLQSAAQVLSQMDPNKIDDLADIQDCLDDARRVLSDALKKTSDEDSMKKN